MRTPTTLVGAVYSIALIIAAGCSHQAPTPSTVEQDVRQKQDFHSQPEKLAGEPVHGSNVTPASFEVPASTPVTTDSAATTTADVTNALEPVTEDSENSGTSALPLAESPTPDTSREPVTPSTLVDRSKALQKSANEYAGIVGQIFDELSPKKGPCPQSKPVETPDESSESVD